MASELNFSVSASSSRKEVHPSIASTADGQRKVEGGDCGIILPKSCVARICDLTHDLGFDTNGQTVEWLLQKAEQSIISAKGKSTTPTDAPPTPVTVNAKENIASHGDKEMVQKKRTMNSQPLEPAYDYLMKILVPNYDMELTVNHVQVDVGIPREETRNQDGEEIPE